MSQSYSPLRMAAVAFFICIASPLVLRAQQDQVRFNTVYVCNGERVIVQSCALGQANNPANDCIVERPEKPRQANGQPAMTFVLHSYLAQKCRVATPAEVAGLLLQHPAAASTRRSGPGAPSNSPGIWASILSGVSTGLQWLVMGVILLGILGLVGYWAYKKIFYSRYLVVRRSNQQALETFGPDPTNRERNIVEAFDSGNFTFTLVGENRAKPYMMRFTLRKNIRTFKRKDLECLRFAYFAYNRALISNELFYTYRITAMWQGGQTETANVDYLGLLAFWRRMKSQGQGAIQRQRAAVQGFAAANCTPNLHNQTFAQIQELRMKFPGDDFFADMERRFLEGSRWMGVADVKRSIFADSPTPTKFYRYLGVLDQTSTMLRYCGEGSIITIAPQGSGKTACNVIPNLLTWPGSAIVLDVKGEIYEKTSKWRSTVGPIIKFSPLDPTRSKCYNPMATIRREALYVWEDARNMANMIILPGEGGEKNQYFEKRARAVITGIVADLAFWHKPEDRPMRQMLSILNRNGWDEWLDRLRKNPEVEDMRNLGISLAKEHPETLANIISFALNGVDTWTGERINMITRRSDWHPLDLRGSKHPTIYICINPEDIVTYASLLRVFISQHINSLMAQAPGRDADPILFCLDEFPQLGEMEPVVKALSVGRSYGLRLWLFAQAFAQLEKSYKESSKTLMENCLVRTYMNPNSIESAIRISEEIGEAGVSSGADEQSTTSPQELMGQGYRDLQIVLGQGSKPAKVHKNYYFKDAELMRRTGSYDEMSEAVPGAGFAQAGASAD